MLRGILFDFNGVLIDDEPLHLELFQEVLREEGLNLSRELYYADYLGLDDRGCFSAVLRSQGEAVDEARLSRLIARKAAYYQARMRRHGLPAFPGAVELVKEAAAAGLELGIVSGALRAEVAGALEDLDLRPLFKVLVVAEDVSESKPHPEGYVRGVHSLNSEPPLPARLLHPHEVLAIEDSPAGLEAAGAAGLSTLGVAHTYPPPRLAAADQVVPSLAAVRLSTLRRLFAETA